MATLEQKILGERRDNYCDSDEDDAKGFEGAASAPGSEMFGQPGSRNTGPKGVIEDFRVFKQMETDRKVQAEKDLIETAKRFAFACKTHAEEEQELEEEGNTIEEKIEDDDDDFIKIYMQRRMEEMRSMIDMKNAALDFGKVFEIESSAKFLNAVENESVKSTVLVHIYEKKTPGSEALDGCMTCLAREYPSLKFCRVNARLLPTSRKFRELALPTLQAYRNGELVASFIRITDDLGEDFFADELKSFLQSFSLLPEL